MYLSKLKISGFRKLNNSELEFRQGLNILVGPNNIGKTTIIDALRALLASEDGTLRLTEDDLHVAPDGSTKASTIIFQYTFSGLSQQDEADFYHALSPLPIEKDKPQRLFSTSVIRHPNLVAVLGLGVGVAIMKKFQSPMKCWKIYEQYIYSHYATRNKVFALAGVASSLN